MPNSRDPVPGPGAVPAVLRWCLHLLVAGLLLLIALRAASQVVGVVVMAGTVGIVYAVGVLVPSITRSTRGTLTWLVLLLLCWSGLLILAPDAIYLAFPWFFVILHLLPRRTALLLVTFTTVAAISGFAWHQAAFTAAMVIGPVLGAGVAVATVWGYQALQAESEQRRRLIDELHRTRAELAAAEREAGMLDERERLARDIHDTVAQGLSSIQLLLRAAGRDLSARADPCRAADLVEQARQAAQENLTQARRLVAALAPPELYHSSLGAALARSCDTASKQTDVAVTFRQDGTPIPLPTPVEVAMLRIAQSALGNVTRHAHATRAGVTLTFMDTTVNLDIVDDGVGFDVSGALGAGSAPGPEGGFGLISMRSRAQELGGSMTVESGPGQGTAVAVTIDLAATGTPSEQLQ